MLNLGAILLIQLIQIKQLNIWRILVFIKLLGNKSVYEDICDQFIRYIELGILKEGEKLPSCRQLAMDLGVNPNTVSRAYEILEKKGFVISFEKRGVYVKEGKTEQNKLILDAKEQIKNLCNSGLPLGALYEIIAEVYKENKDD